VAARHTKTVISRANLLALYYFRACDCQPSRSLRREGERKDAMNGEALFPGIWPEPFARASARKEEPEMHRQNLKERPPGKFGVLATTLRSTRRGVLWRAPERSVRWYVSTGAQPKRSQNPKSPGVLNA
jgi:hypothetical protein